MDAQTRTIRGATAFNEMTILAREGRAGHHLVDFGIGRLTLAPSEQVWDHLRLVFAGPPAVAALQDAGWTVVGTWAFFTYLKRPVAGAVPTSEQSAAATAGAGR